MQTVVVISLIVASVGYLVYRSWNHFRATQSGCSGCGVKKSVERAERAL